MKQILLRILYSLIAVVVSLSLTCCTFHVTEYISGRLKADELYKSYNVEPTDLSLQSKCSNPPTVKIVNIESRTADYETMINPPSYGVINPKDLMDAVVAYLDYGFQRSHIKVDAHSTKILQIKMVDLKSIAGVWSFGSDFKAELTIPETGFTKLYEAKDNAAIAYTAAAYAIHDVARQTIDDPAIQDYVLCNTKSIPSLREQMGINAPSQN